MRFNYWFRSFSAIEHCVPTCPGCRIAISGVWLSTSWTSIDWSMKGADLGWNNRYFHNSRKHEFYPWHSTSRFTQFSILYSTIHHARYSLRKHLCKNRNLAVHQPTTISLMLGTTLLLIPILPILRLGIHLMVRKLYALSISLQRA